MMEGTIWLSAALDDALCEPYKDLDAILAEADLIIIGASNGLDMERGTYARRSTSCASLIQTPSPRPSSKRLARLVQVHRNGRVAILELGVGLLNGVIKRMLAGMAGFEVCSEDVPRCPHCGWQLAPWVRDDTFPRGNYLECAAGIL